MTSLATQAAEYASAMASAYAMGRDLWTIEALIWSDEAIELAFRVRDGQSVDRKSVLAWAETAARLMTGEMT